MKLRNHRVVASGFVAAALTLLVSQSAQAWEADVHFGLTRWLALQAGATPAVADQLATADQDLDDGAHSAIHSVFHYACVSQDAEVSRAVRDDHFPSTAKIPGLPPSRAVQAASRASKRRAEDRLKNPGPDLRYETELFGTAMHALQDSWSHEGIPDIPGFGWLTCSTELAWGHPVTRAGWRKHDADLTYRWPAKTTADTAQTTFDYIVAFLRKHPQLQAAKPKSWKDIAPEVELFRGAETKTDKKRWFVRNGFSDTSFLNGISLDEGGEVFAVRKPVRKASPTKYLAKAPRDVVSFYASFFKEWAFTYDFAALAATYVDTPRLARALAAARAGVEPSPPLVVQTLRLWRMRDHGKVAALGHAAPSGGTATPAGAALADDQQLARYTGLQDAFISLSGDPEFPFVAEPVDPKRYVALARFANAPYDTLAVVADTIDGRLKVVDLFSVIDH